MKVHKQILFFFGTLIIMVSCNVLPFKDQVHTFRITNESGTDAKSIIIQLDDGDLRSGKSHVFDTINHDGLMANDSTEMHYKFGKPKGGAGHYIMVVELANGKILSEKIGSFDSSLNVNATFNLSISEDKIVYINKTVP